MRTCVDTVLFDELNSLLFIPTLNDKFVASAHTRGADGVILDLEDSVIAERKIEARQALDVAVNAIRQHGVPVLVALHH